MKQRIQVYTTPTMKRRIEIASSKYDIPITKYCFEAIKHQLAADDILEKEHIQVSITKPKQSNKLFTQMKHLREKIKARRHGKLINVNQIIDSNRKDRDHELIDLH